MAKPQQQYSAKDEQKLMTALWRPDIALNPLNFVMYAFPWGKPNTPLAGFTHPRKWQTEVLESIAQHITENRNRIAHGQTPIVYQHAIASGRGIGKSALVGWINLWMMSCVLGSTTITAANSEDQLKSRTWAELGKWHALSINEHWFERSVLALRPAPWFEEALKTLKIDTGYYYAQAQLWAAERPDAFAGVHNMSGMAVLFDEACHDDQTEVLTNTGWKFFKDLLSSDKLMSMDPHTHIAEYLKPTKVFKAHRKGPMYLYDRRGADFCVTPNHEMYFLTSAYRKRKIWQKKQIQKLGPMDHYMINTIEWSGNNVECFHIPKIESQRKKYPEIIFKMDAWLEFLGWYLSEGYLDFYKGIPTGVTIGQKDIKVLERLKNILEENGVKSHLYLAKHIPRLTICSTGFGKYMLTYGKGQVERRIPRYVMELCPRQLKIFINAYLEGDGYIYKKTEVIYTSCKNMADDLHEIYLKLGMRTRVYKRLTKGKISYIRGRAISATRDGYVISASSVSSVIAFNPKKAKIIPYDGVVYCAEVPPKHLLFTRRNGYTLWSGNSGIDPGIWTVTKGFFTDPTLHRYFFAFSNPRRNTGTFFECFHRFRDDWVTKNIDSRTVEGTDPAVFDQIIKQFGEDSDQARIEVLGQFPRQGDNQFIASSTVHDAVQRILPDDVDNYAPLMMGVDPARQGLDATVIRFRQGRNARIIPPTKIKDRDNMAVARVCAELILRYNPDAVCVDAGNGTGVIDRLRELGFKVHEVWFGGKSPEQEWYNLRTYMWAKMREWLKGATIDNNSELIQDLITPEFHFIGHSDKITLETKESIKKRGFASPDHGDALALTFAVKVASKGLKSALNINREPYIIKDSLGGGVD